MKINKLEFLNEAEKKLKKIWDLLRDTRVERFTLSVKLYRDGSSHPKTISVQGERSTDGGWNTWLPRAQDSDAVQSSESLKEKLASIERSIRVYISENALEARWTELEASVKEALKSGRSVEDLEYRSEIPIDAVTAVSYDAHFCAPVMATAYVIEGAAALAKNDLDRAAHCVNRGLNWSRPDMFIPNPQERFSERASKGGKGKALVLEPVKDRVAELLVKIAPEDGWETTTEAVETVANELIKRHSGFVEKCGLKTDNLPRTIAGWIEAEPKRFPHRITPKA